MKKILSILACLFLVVSLTACGKAKNDDKKKEEEAKNTKSIVCNMKDVSTSQDEMTMKMGYKFDFVDEKATDFVMTYNLKVNKESEKKRKDIISYFEKNKNLEFIVLNNMPLFEDGVHFDYEGHKKMATTIERILERDE